MSKESEDTAPRGILTGNVDDELTPADYSIVTSQGGSYSGPEGRWSVICAPEDGRALARVGVFECEPHEIDVPLQSDELMFALEGNIRLELEDGSAVELGKGDMAVLPGNTRVKINWQTRCKILFVTAASGS